MKRLGALVATSAVLAGLAALGARGAEGPTADALIGATGETSPSRLPRSRTAPGALRVGFTSALASSSATPELTAITIGLSRSLELRTKGLPSCPITELYSSDAEKVCAGSLVGQGTVISEVTLPGHSPVIVEGRLLAFFDEGEGTPRILAQVIGSEAMPLTYVIPFTIGAEGGPFGTVLSVSAEQMRHIQGICARGHPNCFAQTYTYKGIYGHIAKFEMTLARRFTQAGRRLSLVNARCPAGRGVSSAAVPLVRVALTYPPGETRSQVATARCTVSPPRGHRHG